MITLRGTKKQAEDLAKKLDLEEGYPNAATLTDRYAAIEQDGADFVLVLPDKDADRVKPHKGKNEVGDTRAKKVVPLP